MFQRRLSIWSLDEGVLTASMMNAGGPALHPHNDVTSIQGTWEDGHLSGHATVRYKSGDRYTGGFEKGIRSGTGTMFSVKTG